MVSGIIPDPRERCVVGRLILQSDLMNAATAPAIQWTKIDTQRYGLYVARDIGYAVVNGDAIYRGGIAL